MRLRIKRIGKVKNADVKLNGLTVIAGSNSSGKSTVGKILFSAVKAVAEAKDNDANHRMATINKHVTSLYTRIMGVANRYKDPKVDELFPIPYNRFVRTLIEKEESGSLQEHIETILCAIQDMEEATPRMKSLMKKDLDNIVINLKNKDNRAATIKTIMEYSVESEFMNNICSFGYNDASIELSLDEDNELLEILIQDEKVSSVKVSFKEPLIDATYVESPLYIHMLGTLLKADTFREAEGKAYRRSMLPIHIKDLAEKIDGLKVAMEPSPYLDLINIRDIIHGEFQYDKRQQSIFFKQGDNKISPINVASGIKSFGLVQMLLQTNTISANKMLIWDEPENHLHPEWQIAFAKLLVQLSKMGIPIVVSSHSPYFVQGVRYFAAQEDLEKYVNYYLAEIGEDNLAELQEVTNDLNSVFVKLSKPLNMIMNVDLVRHQ